MILNIVIVVVLYIIMGCLLSGMFEGIVVDEDDLFFFGILWPVWCIVYIVCSLCTPFISAGHKLRDKLFPKEVKKTEEDKGYDYRKLHKIMWAEVADLIESFIIDVKLGNGNLDEFRKEFVHVSNLKMKAIDNNETLSKWKKDHEGYPFNTCFACEGSDGKCSHCIIDWGVEKGRSIIVCEQDGTVYNKFRQLCHYVAASKDIETALDNAGLAIDVAYAIANMVN